MAEKHPADAFFSCQCITARDAGTVHNIKRLCSYWSHKRESGMGNSGFNIQLQWIPMHILNMVQTLHQHLCQEWASTQQRITAGFRKLPGAEKLRGEASWIAARSIHPTPRNAGWQEIGREWTGTLPQFAWRAGKYKVTACQGKRKLGLNQSAHGLVEREG